MVAPIHKADKFIAAGLGVLSLVVYLATLSAGAYPGAPAMFAVQSMGLTPRMTPDHPLWNGLAWLVGKGGVQALNVSSAVWAALGIALLYDVTRRAIITCFRKPEENAHAAMAARVAALGAALALAFSTPYWCVATRLHPASFHITLFLVAVHVFFRYMASGSVRTAMIFSFIYGLGIAEYATFITFFPLFGLGLLFLLWRREQLSVGRALTLAACMLSGLMLYLVAALAFYKTAGYALREYADFFQIIRFMWRDQYWMLSRSLPQQGWLLILITTAVPWITALSMAKRAMTEEQDWTFHILHVVLTALATAVLLNVPIAPWPQFGFRRLLIMPYLLVATTYGYLLAYWYVNSCSLAGGDGRGRKILACICRGLSLAGLILLLCLPIRNYSDSDGRPAASVKRFAEELVANLEGREWLITNGAWDAHLLLAAHRRDQTLKLINMNRTTDRVYQNYLATLFDSPGLRSRLHISIQAMIHEWFRTEPDILMICAVQDRADLWISMGFNFVPNGLVFFGSRDLDKSITENILADNREIWGGLQSYLDEQVMRSAHLEGMLRNMLRHMGLLANNLGFLLEDVDQPRDAFAAYAFAREMDAKNVSALMNQSAMLASGFITDDADTTRQEMDAFLEGLDVRYRVTDVVAHFGLIRSPEAFVGIWTEANPESGATATSLARAVKLLPSERQSRVKEMLAHVYFQEARDDESEALYFELLAENPDNQRALLGMARLAMRKGRIEDARDNLEKAEQVGVPPSLMSMEWASFDIVRGETGRARERLERLLKDKPNLERAWFMLAGTYISQRDIPGLHKCVERLRRLGARGHALASSEGHLALFENRASDASVAFEEALSFRPHDTQTLEMLLRLDMLMKREAEASMRVKLLLTIDPDNIVGNRVLGAIHVADKEYELAADSFKRVTDRSRDPASLNDLAWVLQESGLYDEAEANVREALEINDELHQAWDTLGVIFLKTDRRGEARKAFTRSLSINARNASAAIHLMKLDVEDGNHEAAGELLSIWLPLRGSLPPEFSEDLALLGKALSQ